MSTAATTYTFTAGTDAVASEVNTNFSDLVTFINGECVQRDGSLAMTQPLTLSGAPTSSLHAATKAYVDTGGPHALGVLGYAEVTASQLNLSSSGVDLTGLTAAVTVGTSRQIRITAKVTATTPTANSIISFKIQEGATVLGLGLYQKSDGSVASTLEYSAVVSPSSGAHTYKLAASSPDSLGDLLADDNVTWGKAFILVEDIGAA